jgi:hypothetical protein
VTKPPVNAVNMNAATKGLRLDRAVGLALMSHRTVTELDKSEAHKSQRSLLSVLRPSRAADRLHKNQLDNHDLQV